MCKYLILGGQFYGENSACYMRKLKLSGSYFQLLLSPRVLDANFVELQSRLKFSCIWADIWATCLSSLPKIVNIKFSARSLPSCNATNIWIACRQNSHWISKVYLKLNFSCLWACGFQQVSYWVAMQLIFGLHFSDKIRTETRRFNVAQFQLHFS